MLNLLAEFTERAVPEAIGAVNTRAWLRHRLRETPGAAGATAQMAAACSAKGRHAQVGAALAAGAMNWDQARVVVKALDKLPAKTSLEHREFARELLVEKSAELNAEDLRKIGTALRDAADPDGTVKDEEEIDRVRGANYRDHHDGTHSITWRDSIENLALLKAAVGALDAPRPQPNGAADPRTAAHRRADALVEIFGGILRHGGLPNARGQAPHLHLTFDLDTLNGLDGAARAALATGGALTVMVHHRGWHVQLDEHDIPEFIPHPGSISPKRPDATTTGNCSRGCSSHRNSRRSAPGSDGVTVNAHSALPHTGLRRAGCDVVV